MMIDGVPLKVHDQDRMVEMANAILAVVHGCDDSNTVLMSLMVATATFIDARRRDDYERAIAVFTDDLKSYVQHLGGEGDGR